MRWIVVAFVGLVCAFEARADPPDLWWLQRYEDHSGVNMWLRGLPNSEFHANPSQIAAIDRLLADRRLPQLTAHRGIYFNDSGVRHLSLERGATWRDPGFVNLSLARDQAKRFVGTQPPPDHLRLWWKVQIPGGSQGLRMNDLLPPGRPFEREQAILLPRDSLFRNLDVRRIGETSNWVLRSVLENPTKTYSFPKTRLALDTGAGALVPGYSEARQALEFSKPALPFASLAAQRALPWVLRGAAVAGRFSLYGVTAFVGFRAGNLAETALASRGLSPASPILAQYAQITRINAEGSIFAIALGDAQLKALATMLHPDDVAEISSARKQISPMREYLYAEAVFRHVIKNNPQLRDALLARMDDEYRKNLRRLKLCP
jgi:hypothetical protein